MTMTNDEFFEKLAETKDFVDWKKVDQCIEGETKNLGQQVCPLTAVHLMKHGEFIGISMFEFTKVVDDPFEIADAADGDFPYDTRIRAKLLEILGL